MAKVDLSKLEVQPEADVLRELEDSKIPLEKLVSEAVKFVDGSEEQDLAVTRYFIEKEYSEAVAGWLVREANTRRAAGSKP